MALQYFHGKRLHDAAYRLQDPNAMLVKRLWSAEGDVTYEARKRHVISLIGQPCWDVLASCRSFVGDEEYYNALYDAL